MSAPPARTPRPRPLWAAVALVLALHLLALTLATRLWPTVLSLTPSHPHRGPLAFQLSTLTAPAASATAPPTAPSAPPPPTATLSPPRAAPPAAALHHPPHRPAAEPTDPPPAPPVTATPVTAALANPDLPADTPPPADSAAKPPFGPDRPLRPPPPLELHYRLSAQRQGQTHHAHALLTLSHDTRHYHARLSLHAWPSGSREQSSRGALDPAWGYLPERYGDRGPRRPEQALHFERHHPTPRLRHSRNAPDLPLPPDAQDRLSALLQLAALLASRPHAPAGTTLSLPSAGIDGLAPWTFHLLGSEQLELPIGPTPTLHLRRDPAHPYDNQLQLWLAPALWHLPARLWWRQANGDTLDLQLERADLPSPPLELAPPTPIQNAVQ